MSAPLGDEERAKLEQRLAELKAQKAAKERQQQFQDPNGYDEEEEEEPEENYDDGDAFFNNVPTQTQPKGVYQLHTADDDHTIKIEATDKDAIVRRVIGDFELLRLAKMGDYHSLLEFAKANGEDVTTFEDNKGRNALHYAADSGNASLIQSLGDLKLPYKADETGLTPLAIAVLNQASQEAVSNLQLIAKRYGHKDSAEVPQYYDVLHQFAPEPPKFVLSKPTPAAPAGSSSRQFWSSTTETVKAEDGVELTTTVVDSAAAVEAQQGDWSALHEGSAGLRGWLEPLRITQTDACTVTAKENGTTVATVTAQPLGGELKGFGKKLAGVALPSIAVANHLAVSPAKRHTPLVSSVLRQLHSALADKVKTVCFTTNSQLSTPPTAVCTVKWFQRVIQPQQAFQTNASENIFGDFYFYDTVLRADAICKNALTPALMKRHEADLSGWSEVDPQSKEQMEILLTFLQTNLTDANAELAYIPSTVDDVRRTLAADGLHKVYVWRAASGEIKDLVSFSIRRAREDTDRCDVAQVVFALFTHKTAVAKAEHCLVIADHLLHASVLYIPALFGFTDSDLVKASLEEVPSCREFLYLTSLEDPVKTVVAPTPASKVYPPVYCV